MRTEGSFYRNVLDDLRHGVYLVDRDRKVLFWSKGAERITGVSAAEIVGARWDDALSSRNGQGAPVGEELSLMAATLADGLPRRMDTYIRHKDGHQVPVSVRVSPVTEADGAISGAVEVFSNDASKVEAMRRIRDLEGMALLDSLTGLGNRRHIEKTVRARLEEMRRYGWVFGLLFVDIDHFKRVNDRYGHGTGDEALKMVVRALTKGLRPFDLLGRWGGEEFVAIVLNIPEGALGSVAERCCRLVEEAGLPVSEDLVQVTVSIGGALARLDDRLETLMGRADELMYRSKQTGRNCVTVESGA